MSSAALERFSMFKDCAIPHFMDFDSYDCKCSKIGGQIATFQGTAPICPLCGGPTVMVAQLYIKTLPAFARLMFPPALQNSTIVLTACRDKCQPEEGDINIVSTILGGNQMDKAEFVPDEHAWFTPRTIKEWGECKMQSFIINDQSASILRSNHTDPRKYLMKEGLSDLNPQIKDKTYLGGFANFTKRPKEPIGMSLLLCLDSSEGTTSNFDGGRTAQIWMTTGSRFGDFSMTVEKI